MKSVLLFCLLVGLEVVYSNDGADITVIEEMQTITYKDDSQEGFISYHTMTIPTQSFFASPSQGNTGRFVRDRASPQPPMISFNNGDIQHIIEEMHIVPRAQKKDEDDCDAQVILFSIDPADEDLPKAMKKNSHVETRLPVFFQQIPDLQAPLKKVIPQAPAQRIALQSPLQQEQKAVPSKPIGSSPKPIKQERLPNYGPIQSHKPNNQGKSLEWGESNPLHLEMDGNTRNSMGMFEDLLKSFLKAPLVSDSKSDDSIKEKKLADRKRGFQTDEDILSVLKSLTAENPRRNPSQAATKRRTDADEEVHRYLNAPKPTKPTRVAPPTSSVAMPKITVQSPNQTPAKNVIYLDSMPEELIKLIESMNGNEGLPQNMAFSPLFI